MPPAPQGMHKVDFDDGDQAEYNLAGETWRVATLQDEAEAAQNNFVVAFPPAHGPALHSPRAPGAAPPRVQLLLQRWPAEA